MSGALCLPHRKPAAALGFLRLGAGFFATPQFVFWRAQLLLRAPFSFLYIIYEPYYLCSRPHKKGRVLPTRNISLNAFGNVRNHRNIISTFRNKKNHFINSTGIFKRGKSGNKALYIFEKRAVQYKKTFPFFVNFVSCVQLSL